MEIKRLIYAQIKQKIQPGKVLVLYGPRRVGKTYLLKTLEKELGKKEKILFLNGEKRITQKELSSGNPEQISQYIGKVDLLIIDEAQKIPEVGTNLKLIVDSFPELKIIASGSASFDLAQKVGEPLTGRKKTINLFPVSAKEIVDAKGAPFYYDTLEQNIIFGGYPELFSLTDRASKKEYLNELADAYLLKDILELEKVKDAKKIRDLLTLLAFQIGQEVSLVELGNSLDLSKNTVYRYLDLLEKAFVIVNLRGFSRNLRKEVTKSSRYYFYDNGIRNTLINNFNALDLRDDVGMLWENYIVIERIKKQKYSKIFSNNYFWRTYDKKEIDWVEEMNGKLCGYEIKWGNKSVKAPKEWLETYDNASFEVVNKENHLKFIL
jgi:hypothetical protein